MTAPKKRTEKAQEPLTTEKAFNELLRNESIPYMTRKSWERRYSKSPKHDDSKIKILLKNGYVIQEICWGNPETNGE